MKRHPVFDAGILDGVQLLEADAGTGKTWTIAGLVVRALVERSLDLDRILVVTFTNAAAAELAERIRLRIAQLERLLDDRLEGRLDGQQAGAHRVDEPFCIEYAAGLDDAGARRARDLLRIALARIDELSVHTIHGWCQRVIDEHALSIGVPRALPIGPGEGERIARRVADWWRREVLDGPLERLMLFALAGIDPASLEKGVRAIVSMPLARVASSPCDWRALATRAQAAREALVDAVRTGADDWLEWIRTPGKRFGQWARYGERWLTGLQVFCAQRLAKLPRATIERFAGARLAASMPDSAIPGCCDVLLEIDDELRGLLASAAGEIVESLAHTRSADLARASSLAFDDLLRFVHEALIDPVSGPALARALRERHPVAFVDECQDTDPLQWDIVRRVYAREQAGAGSFALVLVGDPKQAIYSFRGADLHSYLHARSSATQVHRLDENQRSDPALIEAVNALFLVDDPFRVEGISFRPAMIGRRARRAFEPVDPPEVGGRAAMTVVALQSDVPGAALRAGQARGQAIAATVAEIGRLLACGTRYAGRALQPGDVAVLVQSRAQGASVKRALARAGIGAAEISRDSVLDTLEGNELMRVVAAVDECADPARLRSALTTTLFGYDAAALAALEADSARMLAVSARFAEARVRWERKGPLASLRPLLHAFGYGARLAALVDGERRLTNVGHLISLLAEDTAAAHNPREGLRAWARMRVRPQGDDDTRELRLESDENLVRILTVHKSKGLEFPVVFLPFAWSAPPAATPDPCVRHERDNEGIWRAVLELSPDEAARDDALAERQAENLRTLYVALTRAEQRCYVFWGITRDVARTPLAWLLHGDAEDAAGEDSFALDADGLRDALEHWKARTDQRHRNALAIVDIPTLLAGSRGFVASRAPGSPASKMEHVPAPLRAEPVAPALAARAWTGTIAAPLVTTSFSAIAAALLGGDPVAAQAWSNVDVVDPPAPEVDVEVEGYGSPASAAGARDSIRFRFPAGAQAGVCLHGILEQASFGQPPDVSLVAHWLARCGYRRFDAQEVCVWLGEVARLPLCAPDGSRLALSALAPARQLRELEFQLSADGVSDRALTEALADALPEVAAASARRWRGFLRGFIDLVFEHEGRWYILDWKSNHLGDGAARYRTDSLARAMRMHAYPLQAALYTLAVHRWLRRTLPGYDYERAFGGVFYVFLRGAGLEPAPDSAGFVCGVHASRPHAHTIGRLDRLFAGDAGDGAR